MGEMTDSRGGLRYNGRAVRHAASTRCSGTPV